MGELKHNYYYRYMSPLANSLVPERISGGNSES